MKWDLVRALVDKDFKEFKKNKYILYTIISFPIIFSIVIPMTTIGPLLLLGDTFVSDIDPGDPPVIDINAVIDQDDIDLMMNDLSENETLLLYRYHIKDANLSSVIIRSSIVEDTKLRDSIVFKCHLKEVDGTSVYIDESYIEDSEFTFGEITFSKGREVIVGRSTFEHGNTIVNEGEESEGEYLASIFEGTLLMVFVLLPAITPTLIASYSIIGEKKSKSLEPLLATPMSDSELLMGKIMAALIPTMAATYSGYFIFTLLMQVMSVPVFGYNMALTPTMLMGIFLLAPLVGLMSIEANVLISSKMNDVRAAQQVGGMVVLPLIFIFMIPMTGMVALGPMVMLIMALIIAIVDVVILKFNLSVFNRENILVKWSG